MGPFASGTSVVAAARPSSVVVTVSCRTSPAPKPPLPRGTANNTFAPPTGRSPSSRTSTTGCTANRVLMTFAASSPSMTMIFKRLERF